MKKTTVTLSVIVIIIIALYFIFRNPTQIPVDTSDTTSTTVDTSVSKATSTPQIVQKNSAITKIGTSVENRDINAYHYGTGATELLFIGGIHGGYEWNTSLVAYQLINYLNNNPKIIPANVRITVIPVLNPDGLNTVVGTTTGNFTQTDVSTDDATVISGRFNANNVDLNRNFDCDWKSSGTWQNKTVSGGTKAFSEPESQAIQTYVKTHTLAAVIVWYSAAGGVYASNCHAGVSTKTDTLTKIYASASGYSANESFDFYATTGDMTNWLAKNSIPAISVLLTNHTDTEWSKNLAGIQALLTYYSK